MVHRAPTFSLLVSHGQVELVHGAVRSKNQSNTTELNGIFSDEELKKKLLRWDSNPRHTAYEADALPTEQPRQLSWLD